MIDINRVAEGLAADLLNSSDPAKQVECLLVDAFRRGLQLGLSIPRSNPKPAACKDQPMEKDDDPWTTTH
jgi:hypothetical protein